MATARTVLRRPAAARGSILAEVAGRHLRTARSLAGLPLGQAIVALRPEYREPVHLAPLTRALERIDRGEQVRLLVSVPPRHGKTDTVLAGLAWLLARHPGWPMAYVSYADDIAADKCRVAQRYAEGLGLAAGDKATQTQWETAVGGGLWSAGVQGQLTGRGFRVIVVDDPHKNRAEAESPTVRRRVYDGWCSDITTRREPAGTSEIVVQARWHRDDLIGQIRRDAREGAWDVVELPALSDAGEALAPWMWTAEQLAEIRETVGVYGWESLYQQRPRARGASVFADAYYYDALPSSYRVAIGVDLAYTRRTHADWSVALVMAMDPQGRAYVLDVVRRQVQAPEFALALKACSSRYPGARMRWYAAGPEMGVADFLRRAGIPVTPMAATADKFVRAQPVAAGWAAGRVLVPREAPWLDELLDEVLGFTGVADAHDDQVDALAAAWDALTGGGTGRVDTIGRRATAGLGEVY